MGIAVCIQTLEGVVSAVNPVRMATARFARLPDGVAQAPKARGRLFDLTVTGSADPGLAGFRNRRQHLVDLTILYPKSFGGLGQESVTIAEDVAVLVAALGESNVGDMAGVGLVYPPESHSIDTYTPIGSDVPSGLVVTIPFIVEVGE